MKHAFTGKGDRGKSTVSGCEIDKNSPITSCLGNLDELVSLLGFFRASLKDKSIKETILTIQNDIFTIQANVAFLIYKGKKPPKFGPGRIRGLENLIALMSKNIPEVKSFVIPGATVESALGDLCRAVARNTERNLVALAKEGWLRKDILPYANRLSSFLFILSRYLAAKSKITEEHPRY
ncbi:ATP:cob(I)alamin adenosyltransferase [candidate division WWE3 bacterium CG08_land_8_20_14_0_20_40_13]|uniref:Corrinoid adenosyltransferase n=1 Tax=candidate division WWE3 bacterium CG08_land_8_20_14_0_20_40_13 TaxID=1975084 RepID=A0A2H0XD11_UNCKA|nr:MAG: ATP:cob(I)alamin adenosyltransferase [candidate division WWE3 bacterium CG08_land_8_20_14_0_20_40_13]